jgi:hypothetical protein
MVVEKAIKEGLEKAKVSYDQKTNKLIIEAQPDADMTMLEDSGQGGESSDCQAKTYRKEDLG